MAVKIHNIKQNTFFNKYFDIYEFQLFISDLCQIAINKKGISVFVFILFCSEKSKIANFSQIFICLIFNTIFENKIKTNA